MNRAMAHDDRERRRANVRLALILASTALALTLGFVAKVWLFGG
jgi:hypothetical protein